MPRAKAKAAAQAVKKTKQSLQDISIEDRLIGCARGDGDHIIYVGQLVERVLKSEFGSVLKALTVGKVSNELKISKATKGADSDRILGRLEMADSLWDDLEQYVLDKEKLVQPVQVEEEKFTHTADEPRPYVQA